MRNILTLPFWFKVPFISPKDLEVLQKDRINVCEEDALDEGS